MHFKLFRMYCVLCVQQRCHPEAVLASVLSTSGTRVRCIFVFYFIICPTFKWLQKTAVFSKLCLECALRFYCAMSVSLNSGAINHVVTILCYSILCWLVKSENGNFRTLCARALSSFWNGYLLLKLLVCIYLQVIYGCLMCPAVA
jgi:hypothetical protein